MNEHKDRAPVPTADLEQDISNDPDGKEGFARSDSLVDIHVISYRKRNHDPDGISVKAVLDGIVREQILQDDSAKEVGKVTFESRKSTEEKTVILITSRK